MLAWTCVPKCYACEDNSRTPARTRRNSAIYCIFQDNYICTISVNYTLRSPLSKNTRISREIFFLGSPVGSGFSVIRRCMGAARSPLPLLLTRLHALLSLLLSFQRVVHARFSSAQATPAAAASSKLATPGSADP